MDWVYLELVNDDSISQTRGVAKIYSNQKGKKELHLLLVA